MEPNNLRFGGGVADTIINPFVALALILAMLLVLLLPRRQVIVPLFLSVFLIPMGQVVVIGGAHFNSMRILIVTALARIFIFRRSEGSLLAGGFLQLDSLFLLFAVIECVAYSVQWMASGAFVYSLGTLLDTLGGYLILRALVRNKEDVQYSLKVLSVTAVILAASMLVEQIMRDNVFAALGGGRGLIAERAGKVRSQATFQTYLTAGAFGATLLPALIWLYRVSKSKRLAALGIAATLIMALTTVSSTPLVALAAGVAAACFWRFRRSLPTFRWVCLVCLVSLQFVMKAPVWALIARIDLTGQSSGYHRYMLVDNLIRHFADWWFIGYKNYDTWGWDMWDLSDQYVAYGLRGGLATLVLFVACIWICFVRLGRARIRSEHDRDDAFLYWCLGSALFAHLITFLGVSYFDQMIFAFYALLAMIVAATVPAVAHPASTAETKWRSWDSWAVVPSGIEAEKPAFLQDQEGNFGHRLS